MDAFFQIAISGVVVGSIYGMAALGFTIVFNATRLINFANGDFVMAGGVCLAAALASWHLPLWGAVLVAVAATAAAGWVLHLLTSFRAHKHDHLSLVMLTIGAAVALRGLAALLFGRDMKFAPDFGVLPPLVFGEVVVPVQGLWIVAALAATSALLWLLFGTRLGKAVKAASQEPRAAALCGIEPRRMAALSFVLAAGLGGLAGAFVTPIAPAFYENGIVLGLKGFAAAIVGGIGNPLGAIVGGILIGLVESAAAGTGASGAKDAIAFLLLVVVLIVRPAGLLGRAQASRV